MWIVYYWAKCPIVGNYLDKMRFDTARDAKAFARANGGTIEKRIAFA